MSHLNISIYISIVQSQETASKSWFCLNFILVPSPGSKWACLSLHGRIENKIFLNPFYFILFYFIRKTLSIQFKINSK